MTSEVEWKLAEPTLAKIENLQLKPLADGQTKLIASWNGFSAETPLAVTEATKQRPISFALDIMPVLTRTGCNTGSCHGAARGKDGFRLSLFGFDPQGDYQRITREIGVRRINLALPEQSLMLLKGIGGVPHTGGKRIEPGSVYYHTVLAWLQAGAVNDPTTPPICTKVELFPPQAVLEGEGAKQRLVAVAHYSDGTMRDVSNLAAFTTNNERSAAVTSDGSVTGGVRGEAFVMARFDTHTVGAQVLTLPVGLQYNGTTSDRKLHRQTCGEKLKNCVCCPAATARMKSSCDA